MNNKLRNILLILATGFIINSCGGGGGSSSSSGGGTTSNVASPITIDNAGTVPVMGQSSTTSVIYVHNNTNQTISGISYSSQINTNTNSTSGLMQKIFLAAKELFGIKSTVGNFLDSTSVGLCSTIPAGQSCPLVFNTPVINAQTAQGSALITASYSFTNKSYSFSQILNYAIVDNSTTNGAIFNSGTVIHGFGNEVGYATVYMYGSGNGKVYTVTGINADKPGVAIINGNISGMQIQSNYVQAVEVSASTGSLSKHNVINGYAVNLTATSVLNSQTYFSKAMLSVPATTSGAILVSGIVPLVNAVSALGPTGTLFITNAGNMTATLSAPSFPSGVTTAVGGTCGATLTAGSSCTIKFSVSQTGGSGTIQVDYTGGAPGYTSLLQDVVWYNGIGGALLQMYSSNNPLTFSATVGSSATITVKNIGGYDLSSVSIVAPVTKSGSATSSTSGFSCTAGGTSLPISGTCSFSLDVNDAVTDSNGAILVGITGSYNNGSVQTYTRGMLQFYVSNAYAPTIVITPNPATMTINGDGIESVTQTLTVSNSGPATATIESFVLSSNPSYLTITGGTCVIGNAITSGNSCTVIVKLGPQSTASIESGTAVLTFTYSGGQAPSGTTATSDINYTVQADTQNLVMTTESAVNNASGDGNPMTPYIFAGSNTSTKTVTFTYQNQGSNPITITGVSQSNSPIAWTYNSAGSTCEGTTLALNDTCIIAFTNILANNATAVTGGIGSSYQMNLTVPTLVFRDESVSGAQFVDQPTLPTSQIPLGGTILYVTNQQATIANSATELAGVVTVSHTLANATGYAAMTVTSNFESYFTGTPVASSGCNYTESSGVVTQVCVLTPSGGTALESVAYTINPFFVGESMNVLYSVSPANQTVSMTPLAQQVPLQ